jgi:hypothetical protein
MAKREKATKYEKKNYIMKGFIICTSHPVLLRAIKSSEMKWAKHVARMGKFHRTCKI